MQIKIFDCIPPEARFIRETVFLDEQGFEKEYVQEAFNTNWIAPLRRKCK